MKTIILHGILAKKFGKSFDLDVKTAKEACHALACQIPAFYEFMMNAEKQGIKFAIFNGEKRTQKTNIGEKQVDDITTASHIHIMPRVIGSGGKTMGWLQVVAGVVLVGVGAVIGNAGLIAAGAGLILGGVSTLLTIINNCQRWQSAWALMPCVNKKTMAMLLATALNTPLMCKLMAVRGRWC